MAYSAEEHDAEMDQSTEASQKCPPPVDHEHTVQEKGSISATPDSPHESEETAATVLGANGDQTRSGRPRYKIVLTMFSLCVGYHFL